MLFLVVTVEETTSGAWLDLESWLQCRCRRNGRRMRKREVDVQQLQVDRKLVAGRFKFSSFDEAGRIDTFEAKDLRRQSEAEL